MLKPSAELTTAHRDYHIHRLSHYTFVSYRRTPLRTACQSLFTLPLARPSLAMGRVLAPLAICAALSSLAHGLTITKPAAGTTLKAGDAIEVAWDDTGAGPKIADLTTFTLFLCSGGPSTIVGC
jgi:hypothetical protein